MWPGSRPATGWMPNRTSTPALAQLAGELGDRVLRLGDGHAVAGRDDHRRGVLQQVGDVLGVDLAVLAVVGVVGAGAALDAEPAGDDRDERPVHRLAHDVGQVGTGGADERAGDDQQVVAEQEARRGRRPAGVAVEHRHDDRHVAAADRGDQVPAERQRERRSPRSSSATVRVRRRTHTVSADERDERAEVEHVACPAASAGLDLIRADSLRNATIEPVKVTAPMKTPMNTSAEWMPAGRRRPRLRRAVRLDDEVAVPADQHRGQADEAVQHRDQLGHAGHLDPRGPATGRSRRRSPSATTSSARPIARRCSRGGQPDGRDQRDGHAGDAEDVAGARGLVLGQPGQAAG